MYASRSIVYLNTKGTFTPVATELSLPPHNRSLPGRQRVFTLGQDATSHWFWQLAKVHADCNNAGYHQLSTVVITTLNSLSTHATDEEYLGQRHHAKWTADADAIAAASKFARQIGKIEQIIDARNKDMPLKNRTGAGVLPYELLRPTSGPGVNGQGMKVIAAGL
ncbi:hypothetical protein L7F22_004993 [Adiantum nelumboides]|nr:hypothetical protein [Adiantum nelumboides]